MYTNNKKYKLIKIIGFLPFIGTIIYGIFCMFFGFTFLFNTSYGLDALFESIFIMLTKIWPMYIIGIIIIIISNKKLKQLEKK